MSRILILTTLLWITASCGSGGSSGTPPLAEEKPVKLQAAVQIEPLAAGDAKFTVFLNVEPEGTPMMATLSFWFQQKPKGRPAPNLQVYHARFDAPGSYEIFFETGKPYAEIQAVLVAMAGGKKVKTKARWPNT